MNFLVQAHHQGGSLWQSRILFFHLICSLQGKICRHEGWTRQMDRGPGDPLWDTRMQSLQRAPSLILFPLKKNTRISIEEAYSLAQCTMPASTKNIYWRKSFTSGGGLTPNCLVYQKMIFIVHSILFWWIMNGDQYLPEWCQEHPPVAHHQSVRCPQESWLYSPHNNTLLIIQCIESFHCNAYVTYYG